MGTGVGRRGVLGVGAAVLLAGCSGGEPESIAEQRVTVEPGEYRYFGAELNGAAELSLEATVREGPAIDFIVLAAGEFEHYEAEERFQYLVGGSLMDTTGGTASVDVDAGTYYLVVDHTPAGMADADITDAPATADVEFVAQR